MNDASLEAMSTLAFDTHKFVKELTAAGMKTAQAEVLANSYASLLTDRIATKDDLKSLEARMDARFETLEDRLSGKIDSQETRFDGAIAALEDRLNARIAYAQVASVVALSAVIVLMAFLGG